MCMFNKNAHATSHLLLHYLSITFSYFTAVTPTPPPLSPSSAPGCGCSGGLGPDEGEKRSTAVLSLWLPRTLPTASTSWIMEERNTFYLLTALAPWLSPFSLAQTATAQGWGFWDPPLLPSTIPMPHHHHPTHDCLFEVGRFLVS